MSYGLSDSSEQPNPSIQTMLLQTCNEIENQSSCLTKVRAELQSIMGPEQGHQNAASSSSSILSAALRHTLNQAKSAVDMITKFNALSISYREQVAIEDCKELLDFSISELAWSLGEMNRIRTGDKNVHYEGDLKAWLSAALSNQDTCLEGFEGTDRRVENFIRGSLKQVTQLIGNVLALYTQLHALPFKPPRDQSMNTLTVANKSSSPDHNFPSWMSEGDQELVKSSPHDQLGMHVDVTVAADGSGTYRSITEAVNEAPNYSRRRYIIYMKKGIYRENIDMKKKKTNIMFVGDGIGQTVVTGNRNFMQGWTTFRTATVGKFLPCYSLLYFTIKSKATMYMKLTL